MEHELPGVGGEDLQPALLPQCRLGCTQVFPGLALEVPRWVLGRISLPRPSSGPELRGSARRGWRGKPRALLELLSSSGGLRGAGILLPSGVLCFTEPQVLRRSQSPRNWLCSPVFVSGNPAQRVLCLRYFLLPRLWARGAGEDQLGDHTKLYYFLWKCIDHPDTQQ